MLDLATVPNAELIGVMTAWWRQIAHAHAQFYAAMAEVGRAVPVDDDAPAAVASRLLEAREWSSSEIAAALTFTGRRADAEFAFCQVLVGRLPVVWAALRDGTLDVLKARVFADYLEDLTEAQIADLCARFVVRAARWTTGQLAQRLARAIQHIDGDFYRRRYQKGIRERGVSGWIAPDGTATVSAHGLSPVEAAAATERLERSADAIKNAGHPATVHQLRADLMMRLLDGRFDGFTQGQMVATMLADPTTYPDDTADRRSAGPGSGARRRAGGSSGGGTRLRTGGGVVRRRRTGAGVRPAGPAQGASARPSPSPAPNPGPPPEPMRMGGPDVTPRPRHQPTAAPHSRPEFVPVGARCGVEVRIGLATLLGLDDRSAELPGWGPILAEEARTLVAVQHAAEWRFAVTDADGYLILGGATTARPYPAGNTSAGGDCRGGVVEIHVPATLLADLVSGATGADEQVLARWGPVIAGIARFYAGRDAHLRRLDAHPDDRFARAGLRRHVEMRDRTCVFPGCRRPARKAEQDHTVDRRLGGPTVAANLEPLCDRHHLLKHEGGWTLEQPEPGLFRWRSPLGQVYWTRGDPIDPDLPDPVPRGPGEEPDLGGCGPTYDGPIFGRPPRPAQPATPSPVIDPDDTPPF